MHDYQTRGCSKFGASMGRRSDLSRDFAGELQIRKVPIDSGGYDPGGAYWGSPDDLYCIFDAEGHTAYLRAPATAVAKNQFPNASWPPPDFCEADVADMVTSYAECALWSTCGDDPDFKGEPQDNPGGVPLDDHYTTSDLAPEALAGMKADCAAFVSANVLTLRKLAATVGLDWSQLGHDFWLTRNGHGAGFTDGHWPEDEGEALADACGWDTVFGEVDLYVGDDKKIHSN